MRPRLVLPCLLVALLVVTGAVTTPSVAASPQTTTAAFVHPGVFLNRTQLDFIRSKVSAGTEPWKSAYTSMKSSSYASLSHTAHPRSTVQCGSKSNPDYGCTDEREDAMAAYTDALVWWISKDTRYAEKSIQIMDAWSAVLRQHTDHNAPVQAGWAGTSFSRAGELVRRTYTGWSSSRVDRFAGMLRTAFLPLLLQGAPKANGNWELIEMDAAVGAAVFLDDHTSYDKAVALYRKRVAAYIYLKSDGSQPKYPPNSKIDTHDELITFWGGQTTFVDGLAQETCRDFGHTGWGLDAIAHVAETGRIQGTDLYGEISTRLSKALEFHAAYDLGAKPPSWLCHGSIHRGLGTVLEVAYNELHNRLGMSLPNTAKLLPHGRPVGANYFLAWETLTNAGTP
jgi:hypothetical protein